MVKPVLRWFEMHPIKPKTSENVANTFDQEWRCRYPRPLTCAHDNGAELIGFEFQEMLQSYGMISKSTTVKNPQANAILERIHGVIGSLLRTTDLTDSTWYSRCQAFAYAVRCSHNNNLNASPVQLLSQRDMILDVACEMNLNVLNNNRVKQFAKANYRENFTRIDHTYQIGDFVLFLKDKSHLAWLDQPTAGPFKILKVKSNGTILIQRNHFTKVVDIRRVRPYRMGGA